MNIEQRKHLAASARIIGMGQFAVFAVKHMNDLSNFKENVPIVIACAAVYLYFEVTAVKLLRGEKNG